MVTCSVYVPAATSISSPEVAAVDRGLDGREIRILGHVVDRRAIESCTSRIGAPGSVRQTGGYRIAAATARARRSARITPPVLLEVRHIGTGGAYICTLGISGDLVGVEGGGDGLADPAWFPRRVDQP